MRKSGYYYGPDHLTKASLVMMGRRTLSRERLLYERLIIITEPMGEQDHSRMEQMEQYFILTWIS